MADTGRDGRGDTLGLVTFTVAGMGFAVPLDQVLEVVRPPELVRIPLGPPCLEGLAQREGVAMPVIGLARVFGAEPGGQDSGHAGMAARVVVVRHRGQPVGLLIDRMNGLVAVAPDTVEPVASDGESDTGVDAELLVGILRDPAAMVLDPGAVIERQFRDLVRGGAGAAFAETAVPRGSAAGAAAGAEEARLVVFRVAGQEFALPVDRVEEIVPAPSTVTRVPRARSHLLGVMTLRDRLLPLVGLRALFGLEGSAVAGAGRVVVVRTQAGGGREAPVGVVVDEVREILRLDRGLIDPVPPLLAREAEFEDIDGIARAEGGRRLVSILSAERMFRHGAALDVNAGETAMEQAAPTAGREGTVPFVVFQLAGAEYGLPVEAVREVLRRPEAPTPLPNAPDIVAGVLTLRGAVVPLIDLRRLLRLPDAGADGKGRGRAVVIAMGDALAGLLVDGMSGILRVPERCIGPAPAVSEAQSRLIRRVANLEDEGGTRHGAGRMILLMDPSELLDMDRLAALLPAT